MNTVDRISICLKFKKQINITMSQKKTYFPPSALDDGRSSTPCQPNNGERSQSNHGLLGIGPDGLPRAGTHGQRVQGFRGSPSQHHPELLLRVFPN